LTMLLFFHRDQGNIELVGMSQQCHDLERATATQDLTAERRQGIRPEWWDRVNPG
jgi:hypothetical protein